MEYNSQPTNHLSQNVKANVLSNFITTLLFQILSLFQINSIIPVVITLLAGAFALTQFTAKLVLCLFALTIMVLLIFILSRRKRNEAVGNSNVVDDYKFSLLLNKRSNAIVIEEIVEGLKHGNIKPFIASLVKFKYLRIKNLTEDNVHKIKSGYAMLQVSYILKDIEGRIAVFNRLGKKNDVSTKLTEGNSILRSFSPVNIDDKTSLVNTILLKIGLERKHISSIMPYAICYTEIADQNKPIVRYFFILYEIVVSAHPLLSIKHGTNPEKQKLGEQIVDLVAPQATNFKPFEFKGNLDRRIIERITDTTFHEWTVSPNEFRGDCIIVPTKKDILRIRIKPRDK